MLILQDAVWNRVTINRTAKKTTWVYNRRVPSAPERGTDSRLRVHLTRFRSMRYIQNLMKWRQIKQRCLFRTGYHRAGFVNISRYFTKASLYSGSHDGLIANEQGKYHELWNAQAQYYDDNTNAHNEEAAVVC